MKYKLLILGTTVDTVPVDFKLDNFMLREKNENIKFSRRLSRSIGSDFFIISLEKNYTKAVLEMSRPDQIRCLSSIVFQVVNIPSYISIIL